MTPLAMLVEAFFPTLVLDNLHLVKTILCGKAMPYLDNGLAIVAFLRTQSAQVAFKSSHAFIILLPRGQVQVFSVGTALL